MDRHSPYRSLIEELRRRSVRTYFQGADQLVVSRQSGPAWPDAGNSFWISNRDGSWYVSTWSPIAYRVPDGADLASLCVEFVDRGTGAQPRVPGDLVERYGLTELSADAADRILDPGEDESRDPF